MQFSLPANAAGETRMFSIAPNQMAASTVDLQCSSRKSVSKSFRSPLPPFSCQPPLADEEEQDGPSTETSSLISGPGDLVDDDDSASKKSTHSSTDITGLALLYKYEFWQLWVLLGLLTGVGLMTIKYVRSRCTFIDF